MVHRNHGLKQVFTGLLRQSRATDVWALISRLNKMRAHLCALLVTAFVVGALPTYASSRSSPAPQPSPVAAVIQLTVIPATRAASVVRELYPKLHVNVDAHANAIVVMGPPDDVQAARIVVSGIGAGIDLPAGQRPSAAQQREINDQGGANGCHSCGAMNPGTKSGNWVTDHQPPSALNPDNSIPGKAYPQCLACSRRQGGIVRAQTKAPERKKPPNQ